MTGRRTFIALAAGALAMLAASLPAAAARAQTTGPAAGLLGRGGDEPIAIEADDGIEWQQQSQVYIARGNAKAIRGEVTIRADELRAYYRKSADDANQIWRLEARGNVVITSPSETVWADQGVYDVDNGVLVLTGRNLRLKTATDVLTAEDSLEYWDKRRMAVARGNATAVRGDQKIRASVITARFREDEKGDLRLSQVEAFDNVFISTPKADARSAYGVYDAASETARLAGSVRISRGTDELVGRCAEMNMQTGVSRLYTCPGEAGTGRVRGVFTPKGKTGKGGE